MINHIATRAQTRTSFWCIRVLCQLWHRLARASQKTFDISLSVPSASCLAILDALMANITAVTKPTPARVKRALLLIGVWLSLIFWIIHSLVWRSYNSCIYDSKSFRVSKIAFPSSVPSRPIAISFKFLWLFSIFFIRSSKLLGLIFVKIKWTRIFLKIDKKHERATEKTGKSFVPN